MMIGILLYPFPNVFLGYSFSICFGLSFLLSPLLAGLFSSHVSSKEQGVGLGTLHAVKGITYAIGPYVFGGLYNLFNDKGIWKTTPFWIGCFIISCSLPVIIYFLPRAIEQKRQREENSTRLLNEHSSEIESQSFI